MFLNSKYTAYVMRVRAKTEQQIIKCNAPKRIWSSDILLIQRNNFVLKYTATTNLKHHKISKFLMHVAHTQHLWFKKIYHK